MPLFGLILDNKPEVYKVIKKTNARLKGSGTNPAIIFLSGKITDYKDAKNKLILICNIRPMLPLPFFKSLNKLALFKALKKEGYKGEKPKFIKNNKLLEVLELIL